MKNILITGSRSGIISKVIDRIINLDYFIYLTVHTESQLKIVKEKYKNYSNVLCLKLDIDDEEDLKQIEDIDVDILVNHAGVGYGGSICEIDMDLVRQNFETNVFSSFRLLQIVIKKMMKKKKGKIIIMSSLLGHMPMNFLGVYSASKASIIMLATSLKNELKLLDVDIKIVLIEPGAYYTGFNEVMLDNKYSFMEYESFFKSQLDIIRKKESFIWRLIEKKNLNDIVNKYEKAILSDNPKFIYRSRSLQVIMVKLYSLFW